MRIGDLVKHKHKRWRYNRMNPWHPSTGIVVDGPLISEHSSTHGITHVRELWVVRWFCVGKRHYKQTMQRSCEEKNLITLSSVTGNKQ